MKLAKIFLDQDSLASQITRNFIGERTFSDLANSFTSSQGQGGVLGFLFDGSKKFGGFLLGGLNFIGWSIGALLQWAITTSLEIFAFDWKQSDAEIASNIGSSNKFIGQQWGRLTGQGLVWLASIGLAAGLTAKFPVIAGRMALTFAEEAGQDLKGTFTSVLSSTSSELVNMVAISVYGGARWVYRELTKDPNGTRKKENQAFKKLYDTGKSIWKYIPFKNLISGFIQGLGDGALDALYDVAYTISFSIDDHFAATREATNPRNNEPERIIEVFPDGDANSEERILISANQSEAITQLDSYLNTYRIVQNRDVGVIVGQPHEDWYGLKPQARKLIIEFRDKEKPPFANKQGKTLRVQISIPDAKRGIDWNDLKTKIPKYTWGNSWVKVIFSNRRFMQVWGATEKEAEQQARTLAQLSTLEIIQISSGTVQTQDPRKKKKATLVYPCFAQMLVRETVINPNNAVTIDGKNKNMTRDRIEIWRDEKPSNFEPLK